MFPNLPVKDRFEIFRVNGGDQRNVTVVGRLRAIPFLQHRLNERTVPTRRKTKVAGCKIGSTSFENHGKKTVRAVGLLSIKL